MKRLVSKLDYEIQRLGKYNINYATEFWNLIKEKNFILQEAVNEVTLEGETVSFHAPTLCHMILENPNDVEENLYNNLVCQIVKNSDLNRLTVFNNKSFLYLILSNKSLVLDEYLVNFILKELNNRLANCWINLIQYKKISKDMKKVLNYNDGEINISLGEKELNLFEENKQLHLNQINTFKEIENLYNLVLDNDFIDKRIKNTIIYLYDSLFYNIKSENKTSIKKIRILESQNRLVI